MKIKLSQLRSIIREEVSRAVNESRPQVTRGRCRGCGDLDAQVVGGYCYDCHADREAREAESLATTTFECRLCGDTIQGEASPEGPGKAGWSSLAGIDGPNSVCPECAERVRQDPSELDDFRDEYPNVRLAENSMETGKCPKCRKSVRLTSNGLISYHDYVNPLGETQNCPGSQNEPV